MAEQMQEQNAVSSASNNHFNHIDEQRTAQEQQKQQPIVKIVFTANNHLGHDIAGQRRRDERLQRLRNAFQQATSFAIAQGADLFIQGGDLFDTTTPDEQDRTFVASCLARLKQAGIPAISLGGTHDTPTLPSDESLSTPFAITSSLPPAPQRSYAQLGALHHFSPLPGDDENDPLFLDIQGLRVGITCIGWNNDAQTSQEQAAQDGNPFMRVRSDVERVALPLLIVHAPIEGIATSLPRISGREKVTPIKRADIASQTAFKVMLDGYSHIFSCTHVGNTEIVTAGATQSNTDENPNEETPGFVYLGLTPDGVRWCNHIPVDALLTRQLTIPLSNLWAASSPRSDTPNEQTEQTEQTEQKNPTTCILEQLEPLCNSETMIRLRLEGEVTRSQYHQLDLNKIRQYGEQHCFSLAIDDSSVTLFADYHDRYDPQRTTSTLSQERGERFSLREEVIALADRWIAATEQDEQERKTLQHVKEDVLAAIDNTTTRGAR